MYTILLLAGLVAGLDNLLLGSSLGLLPLKKTRFRLALAFAVCELLSPFLGLTFGHLLTANAEMTADWLQAICLLVLSGWVLAAMWRFGEIGRWASGNRILLLPVLFCIDNIVSGVLLVTQDYPIIPSALTVGAVSAILSFSSLYIGAGLRNAASRILPARLSRGPEWLCGISLGLLAARIVLAN